jgi:hypothetical protein
MHRGIVVKDPALGGTPGGKPPTDFTPTMVRLVLTVVPPGGTYVAPTKGGSVPTADGGSAPAVDAAATADAGGRRRPERRRRTDGRQRR